MQRLSRRALGAAILATAVAAVLIAYTGLNPFDGRQTVRAEFADASGIGVVGQDVRMAGVPVGEITGVERDGDAALVTMKIDGDAGKVGADATAELRPNLPFEGTAHVELRPGSPEAAPLGEATIAVDRTRSYVPVDEALRTFDSDVREAVPAIAAGSAATLDGAGSAGLRRALRESPALLDDLAPAAAAAGGSHGTELAGAVRNLAATSDELAARSDRLAPLLDSADRTLAAIERDGSAPLDSNLAELPETLVRLRDGGAALETLVARLDPLARELQPGLDALAPTLAEATPLLARSGPVLAATTPLIGDLRAALRSGAAGAEPARSVLAALDPTLEVLDRSLLPALHRNTDELGIPAYVSFLNLFGGGGGASAPFQTGAETTPLTPETGHFMRFGLRFLTGAGLPLPPCALLARADSSLAAQLSKAGGCTP
ncbi:MAG: phospholipid/cholesterol/gamma-HCH transport system substrate-binding protein [Solirubrobacterales bacterium]|jgi:phospholipid/cholesterol/gamma-HCH transport system substrate-binding protein|nr:phospholipid/cholesterol/gamma-HCH transport system substrate-binding protein [Solirubrobacterales bacterium]